MYVAHLHVNICLKQHLFIKKVVYCIGILHCMPCTNVCRIGVWSVWQCVSKH